MIGRPRSVRVRLTLWYAAALGAILLVFALRPNIRRLLNGTERVIGWRARRAQKTAGG